MFFKLMVSEISITPEETQRKKPRGRNQEEETKRKKEKNNGHTNPNNKENEADHVVQMLRSYYSWEELH